MIADIKVHGTRYKVVVTDRERTADLKFFYLNLISEHQHRLV